MQKGKIDSNLNIENNYFITPRTISDEKDQKRKTSITNHIWMKCNKCGEVAVQVKRKECSESISLEVKKCKNCNYQNGIKELFNRGE